MNASLAGDVNDASRILLDRLPDAIDGKNVSGDGNISVNGANDSFDRSGPVGISAQLVRHLHGHVGERRGPAGRGVGIYPGAEESQDGHD